jgi:hypothetical protein
MSQTQTQRNYTTKLKSCANPLFEEWLSEWREDAAQKNSKLQYVYGKVSLKKYFNGLNLYFTVSCFSTLKGIIIFKKISITSLQWKSLSYFRVFWSIFG